MAPTISLVVTRAGVVWDVDFKRGVHVLIGVARGRVFHHRDLITELGGIANGGLYTGVGDSATPFIRSQILPPSEMKSL